MTCKLCAADPNPKNSAPRDCAFDDTGLFRTDNWSCASLGKLRQLCEERNSIYHMSEQSLYVLPYCLGGEYETPEEAKLDAAFITLSTYKRRGRVGTAHVITDDSTYPLTLTLVEQVLEQAASIAKARDELRMPRS